MAYRRKQQTTSSSTYSSSSTIKATKLANENKQEEARIRNLVKPQRPLSVTDADALHTTSFSSRSFPPPSSAHKDPKPREYTSVKSSDESKHGFWGVLARKARAILDDDEDDGATQRSETISNTRPQMSHYVTGDKYHEYTPHDSCQRTDRPALKKGLNALTSSINYIGNAVEGGLNVVENRTAGLIKETRKHIRRKPGTSDANNQATDHSGVWQQHQTKTQMPPQTQTDLELQLKASRDVAMAMAAKSKLLLRELKTVKADLAFAKERCAQLEEENKILRDNRDRGDYPEDDEMIRLQLETLLTEKARLAHENSVYARENRFLREIVEYHQLTMQDVVYLDEKAEEVSEVYPIMGPSVSDIQSLPTPAPLNASS